MLTTILQVVAIVLLIAVIIPATVLIYYSLFEVIRKPKDNKEAADERVSDKTE